MEDEIIIEAQDIWKHFEEKNKKIEVLKGVNLKVKRGEKVAIVGASGSGKTTLLSIIGTILKPTSGKVIIDGEDVTWKSEKELENVRGKKISFVFQNGYLIDELSPLENVELFARKVFGDKAKEVAKKILQDFGVPERKNTWELSGGEYQRVALARAISVMPKVLLADEPTGNLDPETAEKVIDETIRVCQREKIALVIVTHNFKIAEKMDKTYKLENGKLVEL
ncbi:MAG: ABC transporter ATP-binding protein [Candidatus Calescibacterium sp.]